MAGVPGMRQATRRPKSGSDSRTKIPLICDLPVPTVPAGCTFNEAQAAR